MWLRSHAPKARISPAALLRGYASATDRPKGRQCAKAARAPMRAGATSAPYSCTAASARSVVRPRGGFGVRGGIDHDEARAGAAGGGKGSLEAGGRNGAHERGAPPPVAPEGGAGLGIEVD